MEETKMRLKCTRIKFFVQLCVILHYFLHQTFYFVLWSIFVWNYPVTFCYYQIVTEKYRILLKSTIRENTKFSRTSPWALEKKLFSVLKHGQSMRLCIFLSTVEMDCWEVSWAMPKLSQDPSEGVEAIKRMKLRLFVVSRSFPHMSSS